MKSLLKYLSPFHKVIRCPSCQQSLRIPIKLGKRLQIRCSGCQSHFEVSFELPFRRFSQQFHQIRTSSLHQLGKEGVQYWNRCPRYTRWLLAMILIYAIVMMSHSVMNRSQSDTDPLRPSLIESIEKKGKQTDYGTHF